jgi:hypothetical protein
MLKGLSEAAAIALSLVAAVGTAESSIEFPDQCWPNCQAWAENIECNNWFGFMYQYCYWNNGYTYCCNPWNP